tara:strand:- start:2703 stop:3689 length:987 start_codon:yes stop_codon:yes gene_type:complete
VATYYDIFGQKVQYLSSDPSPVAEGQVWYNSSTSLPKLRTFSTAAWASTPVCPYTTRDASGFGTQTAGVIFGGSVPSATSTAVEWNGTSFSAATSIPSGISGLDSDGPQTAGLTAGGSPGPNNTTSFDYNGTSWTANPALNVARTGHATMGNTAAQTAALATGGEPAPASATTSDWDGSSWTAGAANPGWAQGTSGGGTPSAAFVNASVNDGDGTADYNGTSWTAGNNSNHEHNYGGAGGLASSGITFGGTTATPPSPAKTAQAEIYDGTCWTSDASMNEARSNTHGKATVNGPAILVATGNPGPPGSSNVSEEYTGATAVTQTITTT